jgi:hypothetical protein
MATTTRGKRVKDGDGRRRPAPIAKAADTLLGIAREVEELACTLRGFVELQGDLMELQPPPSSSGPTKLDDLGCVLVVLGDTLKTRITSIERRLFQQACAIRRQATAAPEDAWLKRQLDGIGTEG